VKKNAKNLVSKKQEEDLSSQNAKFKKKTPLVSGVFFSLVEGLFMINIRDSEVLL
jgi:hypothetical protein